MSEPKGGSGRHGLVRGPQSLAAGLGLLALGVFAVWAGGDLPQGTLGAMGPGLMPRWLGIGVATCGVALLAAAFVKDGDPIPPVAWRGLFVVVLAIIAFAVTIRPVGIGSFMTPGLGLIVAGPLAIMIGGYASPEARFGELVILALLLTAGCMLLFGDLLNLPIPIFPTVVIEAVSGSISTRLLLRIAVGVLIILGLGLIALRRGANRRRPVDVATHSLTT
ncbi:MAG: tripartite tricarboxylate transporter TctB family protein [Methylobacterium sp.]|uniref:tripartite tricarboxylate transporter TctB family protein n=1 Tax=Methylobacterium sp. TaxID=409 RepID=UPI0025D17C23|nr:tripartite tricarboxylate transporter TctB family protein [Methylobacterium sp.]MBX9934135.1 tripartite tricarboxylate transporter TctB family protein [Methylobacterium sp.]